MAFSSMTTRLGVWETLVHSSHKLWEYRPFALWPLLDDQSEEPPEGSHVPSGTVFPKHGSLSLLGTQLELFK